jgi:hypothetical protein
MNVSDPSLVRAIRGPVTLITVGVLFALNNFTQYRFDQTWPVILIVFGLLSLLRRAAPPAPSTGTGSPSYGWPPPPSAYNAGGYRQSQYPGVTPPAPSGPVKGGFESSAAPRPGTTDAPPPSGGEA